MTYLLITVPHAMAILPLDPAKMQEDFPAGPFAFFTVRTGAKPWRGLPTHAHVLLYGLGVISDLPEITLYLSACAEGIGTF